MINAWWKPLTFLIQEGRADTWHRVLDTALPSPDDFAELGYEPLVKSTEYELSPRSVVVLARGA